MVGEFWQRLKQRKLVQWSAAYVAGSFAFVQVLDVVAQRFGWPDRIEKLIILALAIGFFVVLVLAWYHGERGAQRVGGMELLIIALLLAIGGGALWRYARVPAKAPVAPAVAVAAKPASAMPSAKPVNLLAAAAVKIPEKSVAVLPFANESGNKDEQFFSDGLSDDLITALSQFAGLKVISRNSAFQFRDSHDSSTQIGKLLGVAHLLEGSVQRSQDEVRITATLVNAADGSIVWSQRYDKPYKDLFALQDAITHSVSDALKAKLLTAPGAVVQSDRPPSGNLAAWTAYQQGKAYDAIFTETSERHAIAAYQRAIALDPNYAVAYAGLSGAWVEFWSTGGVTTGLTLDEIRANARSAIDIALKLDSDSSQVQDAHAYLLLSMDMNWAGAETAALRALQLAPNDPSAQFWLGNILAAQGQNQRAVDLIRQALTSDPRHAAWHTWMSVYLTALGRLDDAKREIGTAIGLQPGATDYHEQLVVIEILRGDSSAAFAVAHHEANGVWREIALALALQAGSDHAAADAALAKLIKDHAGDAAYQIAEVYALRGDADDTFKWLDRAWSTRDPGVGYLLMDPLILRYKNDPRFAVFCKKVGLPTTTDAVAMK